MDRRSILCLCVAVLSGALLVLTFHLETTYLFPMSTGGPGGFYLILFAYGFIIGGCGSVVVTASCLCGAVGLSWAGSKPYVCRRCREAMAFKKSGDWADWE